MILVSQLGYDIRDGDLDSQLARDAPDSLFQFIYLIYIDDHNDYHVRGGLTKT